MKSEKKEKRSSRKSGKKHKKWRNGKPKAEMRLVWKAPKKPLGEMIEDRFFVQKRLYRRKIWLCFDMQENRDVVIKIKRHKRSKRSRNVKGRTALHMQGELEQKKPLAEGRTASPMLLDEMKKEIKENQQVTHKRAPIAAELVENKPSEALLLIENIQDISHTTANLVMKEVEEEQDVFHVLIKEKPMKDERSACPLPAAGKENEQVSRTTSPTVEKLVEGTDSPLLGSDLSNQLREIYINLRPLPIVQDVESQQMIRATSSIAENLVQETPCASPWLSSELINEISEIMTNIKPYLIEKVKENQQVCPALTPIEENHDQDEPSASPLVIDKVNNRISMTYPHLMPKHVCHVRSTEEEKLEQIKAICFLAEVKDFLENDTRRITNEGEKVKYPVKLGDLLDERYFVEEKFWISSRCAVWLCWDLSAKQKVVLKMSTNLKCESMDFRFELDMLKMVHEEKPEDLRKERIIKVFGDFEFMPSEGRFCIVLESMYCDLSHLLETKGKLPLGLIRAIIKQILEGLEYLHSCDIIHTDIKPANIVLSWEKDMQSLSVKIIDFGNACLTDDKAEDVIQTPPYRSPEVWLEIDYDKPADIWSTACLIFELAVGQLLFDSADNADYSRCEDHLATIMELLGPIPREILSRSQLEEEYFDEEGQLKNVPELNEFSLENTLMQTYEFPPQHAKELAEFMLPMLELEPTKRATATQCLQHPWLNGKTNANE